LKKVLVSLAAAAATFLALEGTIRIIGAPPPQPDRPAAAADEVARTFRSPLPDGPKPEGIYRIVALGDSFTWGYGLHDGSRAWPARLEEELRLHREAVEVVNLGVPGFTTVNELEMLGRFGLPLEPDLVVVQYLVNDVLPSAPGFARLGEEWLDDREVRHLALFGGAHRFLNESSALYRFADDRVQKLQRKMRPPRRWEDLYRDDFPGWRDFVRALEELAARGQEMNFRVLFVMFPSLNAGEWTTESYLFADIYEKVALAAAGAGLEVLNLLPFFTGQGRNFDEWHVSPYDPHPGAEAHLLAARVIGDYLRQEGLGALE